jgi:hypothetical protein
MWLLHRGLEVDQDRGESLEQQIVRFSSAVFDAIGTSYPMLRNAGQERLWLIYFKGLLIANTHPHEEMVQALILLPAAALEACLHSRKGRERPRSLPPAALQTTTSKF